MTLLEFDVFGRHMLIERTPSGWRALYRGPEGKHRVAHDLPIPADLTETELGGYLADLCHEWATPQNPNVRRLT